MRQQPDGEVRYQREEAVLSDICRMQGGKRVICHLIGTLVWGQS